MFSNPPIPPDAIIEILLNTLSNTLLEFLAISCSSSYIEQSHLSADSGGHIEGSRAGNL